MDKREEYEVTLVTPAFLGTADQSAQWRSPPFKALLRQWWRVAWWNGQQRPAISRMRTAEGELFGRAADDCATASRLRLRLGDWRGGQMSKKDFKACRFPAVDHREVPKQIGTALYLGFGPVTSNDTLARESALAPGTSRRLRVAYPAEQEPLMAAAMQLIHLFGTVGGRARNGWGSLQLQPADGGSLLPVNLTDFLDSGNRAARQWLRAGYTRRLGQSMEQDWCHAIGSDDRGLLLWRTESHKKWEDVLATLAEAKIDFRTQFHFKGGGTHHNLCDRQLLCYPVTNHGFAGWKDSGRSANQILFKVLSMNEGFTGLIAHLPHTLPAPLRPPRGGSSMAFANLEKREIEVWQKVHAKLDSNTKLTRLP